jgi:hypothetical protein
VPLRRSAWLAPAGKLILLPCTLDGGTALVIDGSDGLQGDKALLTIAGEVLLASMSWSPLRLRRISWAGVESGCDQTSADVWQISLTPTSFAQRRHLVPEPRMSAWKRGSRSASRSAAAWP